MRCSIPTFFCCLAISTLAINLAESTGATLKISNHDLDADADHAIHGPGASLDAKRNRLVVFGAPAERTARSATEPCLMSFDLKTDAWTELNSTGPMPTGTGHPGMTYVASEDAIYLFGGWRPGAESPLAELWRLDLSREASLQWEQLSQTGDWPPARNGMVFECDEVRGRLILHGGDGGPHPKYGYTPLDDLWTFDLKHRKWKKIDAGGAAPQPRWNHAGAIDSAGGRLYVFGGAGYVETPKPRPVADTDVFVLDLTTFDWSTMPKQDHTPRPVQGTSMTFDTKANTLVLVGGLALDQQGRPGILRVYCFDLLKRKWTRSKEILTKKRRDHVGIFDPIRNRHVIFGGQSVIEEGNFYRPGEPFSDAIAITVRRNASE